MSARDRLRPPDARKAKSRVAAALGDSNNGTTGEASIAHHKHHRQAPRHCREHARFVMLAGFAGWLSPRTVVRSLLCELQLLDAEAQR